MQWLINTLFVGGVGLSISAIGTWLVYLSLLTFDLDKEAALNKQRDLTVKEQVEDNSEEIDKLKAL